MLPFLKCFPPFHDDAELHLFVDSCFISCVPYMSDDKFLVKLIHIYLHDQLVLWNSQKMPAIMKLHVTCIMKDASSHPIGILGCPLSLKSNQKSTPKSCTWLPP
eukprot:14696_4